MMSKLLQWLRRRRRLAIREGCVLLCALLLGMGYSLLRAESYLPSMDGNVYAMLAADDSMYLVLTTGDSNSLVHVDYSGKLLNYRAAGATQAFQDLEVKDDTFYAIMVSREQGRDQQQLVSMSLQNTSMRPRVLTELTDLPDAPVKGIVWEEMYLPPEGEDSPALRLVGMDAYGQGYLMRWNLETGDAAFERILEGERLYSLKYVREDYYIFVNQEKETGQFIDGLWQRDILAGQSETPHHISTCGTRCFISDSVTGDIFELLPDGTATLYRHGGSSIGDTQYRYQNLETFTTYPDAQGTIRIIGLCAGKDGVGSVIAGETSAIYALHNGALWIWMLWEHGWKAALVIWLFLLIAVEAVQAILRSPRLVVRLALCEVAMALLLLGSVTVVQYIAFQNTILEDARQKLQLVGGNLAAALSSDTAMDDDNMLAHVASLRGQVKNAVSSEQEYEISVLWSTPGGAAIGYDTHIPEGYFIEDVKSRDYFTTTSQALLQQKSRLEIIRNDMDRDYLYVQPFHQGDRIGCVAVSQSEESLLSGRTSFLWRMIPIFAACPLLFAALIAITWHLLRPLGTIRDSMEEFYTCGGGNQIDLDDMSHTEVYEVARVFNQLSVQTRTQLNTLEHINDAYSRFVPDCLLHMLHRENVLELSPGAHTAMDGALLVWMPQRPERDAAQLQTLAQTAAKHISLHSGMVVDYDACLGALTALFQSRGQAEDCARECVLAFSRSNTAIMTAVLEEPVELGVFGGDKLMIPLAVSQTLYRRNAALALLRDFGAVLVRCGKPSGGEEQRLLGWDAGLEFYESPLWRPERWQSGWHDASALWAEGMDAFRQRDFACAMRRFAKVLHLMPDDTAARWYLFRCETLRDGNIKQPDTGLLFDWKE